MRFALTNPRSRFSGSADARFRFRLLLLPFAGRARGQAQRIVGLSAAHAKAKHEEDRPCRRSSRSPIDNAFRFDELRFRFIFVVIVVEQGPVIFGFLVVLVNRSRLLFKDNAYDEANYQA